MKADLHAHGPIGFLPYWLKKQGYSGKNCLREMADVCLERGIDVCAVISEGFDIDRGTPYDRMGYLEKEAVTLPREYDSGKLGKNILVVEKDDKKVFFVNGQTVIVQEGDKRLDHLVVGSNEVPNLNDLRDTMSFCKDKGLIQIAEHPYVLAHYGLGEKLEEYIEEYDAVEGHNSQLIVPACLSWMPVVGHYSRKSNNEAREFAMNHGKPYIATSDAHRIEDIGLSHITTLDRLDDTSEESLLNDLKNAVRDGSFLIEENYAGLFAWLGWTLKFKKGVMLRRDVWCDERTGKVYR